RILVRSFVLVAGAIAVASALCILLTAGGTLATSKIPVSRLVILSGLVVLLAVMVGRLLLPVTPPSPTFLAREDGSPRLTVRHAGFCPVTEIEMLDPYWHGCHMFSITNWTRPGLRGVTFDVLLTRVL